LKKTSAKRKDEFKFGDKHVLRTHLFYTLNHIKKPAILIIRLPARSLSLKRQGKRQYKKFWITGIYSNPFEIGFIIEPHE